MSEKQERSEGKMPAWLIVLWLGFLAWIVIYIVLNLFKNSGPA